jgi:hypothetical protein
LQETLYGRRERHGSSISMWTSIDSQFLVQELLCISPLLCMREGFRNRNAEMVAAGIGNSTASWHSDTE